MKVIHFLILVLFLSVKTFSQTAPETFQLNVEGQISNADDDPLTSAVVQVYQGSKLIGTYPVDGSGKYAFQLPLNSDYNIVVSAPSTVQKKFTVSTRGVPPDRATSKFSTIKADLSLFEKMEGIDYSILNQPLQKYMFDPVKSNFTYDEGYFQQMLSALQNLRAQEEAARNKKKELEKNYQAAIKNGDKAFQKKDWNTAKAAYNEALKLKAQEYYPKDQITQIDKIIAEQEALNKKAADDAAAKKAAEEAAKKAAEEAAAKKKAEEEAAKKKAADEAAAKKLAEEAAAKKAADEAAAKKKAEEEAAKKKAADEAAAKKLAEEAAAKKLAEEAAAKKAADEAAAKKAAEEAAKKKAEEEAAAKKAADEAAAKKAAEEAAAKKLAEEAAAKKAADEAAAKKAAEEAAAKKKAEEEAAKKKAAEEAAAKKLAEEAAAAKKLAEEAAAKKAADEAAAKKAADEVAAKKAAEEAAAKKKAEEEAAKKKAADEAAAKKLAEEAAAKKAADEAAAKKAAEEAAAKKKAEEEAAAKKAADEAAAKKVAEEAAAKKKAEEEAKRKTPVTLGGADVNYKNAVKKADDQFKMKRYLDAKKSYEEALTYKAGDTYCKNKLIEIEKLTQGDSAEEKDAKIKALLAKYPQGITEETISGNGVVIIQRVLVKGQMAWVYQKKIFSWGGVSYFRDEEPITGVTFEQETKP